MHPQKILLFITLETTSGGFWDQSQYCSLILLDLISGVVRGMQSIHHGAPFTTVMYDCLPPQPAAGVLVHMISTWTCSCYVHYSYNIHVEDSTYRFFLTFVIFVPSTCTVTYTWQCMLCFFISVLYSTEGCMWFHMHSPVHLLLWCLPSSCTCSCNLSCVCTVFYITTASSRCADTWFLPGHAPV